MWKMPGPEARATAMKMSSVLGLTCSKPNGSALNTKVANSQAPSRKVRASRTASRTGSLWYPATKATVKRTTGKAKKTPAKV